MKTHILDFYHYNENDIDKIIRNWMYEKLYEFKILHKIAEYPLIFWYTTNDSDDM